MKRQQKTNPTRSAARPIAIAAASLMLSAGLAAADPGELAGAGLWEAAQGGNLMNLEQAVEQLPPDGGYGELRESGATLAEHLAAREEQRDEQIEKVERTLARLMHVVHGTPIPDELKEPAAEGEEQPEDDIEDIKRPEVALSEALVAAVELSMVRSDREAFLQTPEIGELVRLAEAQARRSEASGEWLYSSELFYRLGVLFFEEGTFKEDSARQSQRLSMLRLYAPERFHEMRNERRLAGGLDELPAYNPTGDTWQERLDGISKHMIMRAINRSAELHVSRTPMRDILLDALNAVETFASTPDLADAFPELGNDAKRSAFIAELQSERQKVLGATSAPGYVEMNAILTRLNRASERTIDAPAEAIYHEFGNGAMAALDDFSAIIWPDELRRFERSTQGAFVGVGIQIQLDELYNIKVVTPIEGSPAHRAGVHAGDLIKAVDGSSTAGFSSDQAVDVITGPADTAVTLTVEREEEGETVQKDIRIVRARIKLPSVKGWRKTGAGDEAWDWFVDEEDGIGYLRLTQFVNDSAEDFDRAIAEMKDKGLNGLVLDLRYNPGGLLDQAVEISNRFVPSGEIVRTEDRDGNLRDSQRARPGRATLNDIPTVVLINENSASASEIVSGAIQDYAHAGVVDALVVGNRSFGKGSVQNVWMLQGNRAAMKVTTQYYKLPAGRLIHRTPGDTEWGVQPDLTVEMLPGQELQSFAIRQNADVLPIDDDGNIIEDADRPDPDTLLSEPIDLQLQTAVVLLKGQVADKAVQRQAQLDKPEPAPIN